MTAGIIRQFQKYKHAYTVGLIGFLVSLGLFYALQTQEERYVLSIAQLGLETVETHLQAELAFSEHILKHVSSQPNEKKEKKSQALQKIGDLLSSYPQFKAFAQLSSQKQADWIKINPQNQAYLVFLENFIKQNRSVIFNKAKTWVSSPISLPDNKLAFFMVYPHFQATEQPVYFIALLDSAYLLQHNTQVPGIIFKVYLNQQPIALYPPNHQRWLFETSMSLYEATWQIKAQAASLNLGLLHLISREAPLSWLTFILGILISILLARSTALSDLLSERTLFLDKINQELKNEIQKHTQTETSKKNLEKALLQGQKLQAIGTLAGGIAHDFNNILYAIRGYVELARDEIPKGEITYKNLGKVLEATYRGQDLISQILTFSRRQQHHDFVPLNLKTELDGALALLRPTVPQTVDIRFSAKTEGKIMGNKTQIHQVIVNLINNAVDAMDGEGKIELTLSEVEGQDIQALKNLPLKHNKYCKIDIQDTGHGMDQSTMDRVFEPFFTTKEVGKGTGLGLSTVHSIVKDHLGEIIVNSRIGKGTTFTLFFPERKNQEGEETHG